MRTFALETLNNFKDDFNSVLQETRIFYIDNE